MGIGFSIFLIALGAVLTFAVKATVAGVDIHVVGWILMAAGVLGLLFTVALFAPRRRRIVVETRGAVSSAPTPGAVTLTPQNVVQRETRDDVV